MQKKTNINQTRRLAVMGIFTAILLIQNYVPLLGNLPIPPLNPTIIHITVIIAALTLGTKDGTIMGLIWGIIRFIKALTMPTTPLDPLIWVNPIITIIPRMMVGLVAGLGFYLLSKKFTAKPAMAVAAFLGSLANTILVMFLIYLFFNPEIGNLMNLDQSNLAYGLLAIIVTNGVPEAILASIVAPMVVKPLQKIKR